MKQTGPKETRTYMRFGYEEGYKSLAFLMVSQVSSLVNHFLQLQHEGVNGLQACYLGYDLASDLWDEQI